MSCRLSQALTEEGHRLDAATQKELTIGRRVTAERAGVERQLSSSRAVHDRLRTQMANYRVPPTIDYIRTNDRVYKLKRKVIIWQRKLDIAKMTLLNLRATHGIKSERATDRTDQSAAGSCLTDQSKGSTGAGDQSEAGPQGEAGEGCCGAAEEVLRVVSARLVPSRVGPQQ